MDTVGSPRIASLYRVTRRVSAWADLLQHPRSSSHHHATLLLAMRGIFPILQTPYTDSGQKNPRPK